jgi:HTH-type transcriptional regulator / antitoxin HipB
MNRGDRREEIFKDDKDRERFLESLGEAGAKTGRQVQALCLMGNHFHLVEETPQGNLVDDKENPGARNCVGRTAQARPPKPEKVKMKNDVTNYIERRKQADKAFAKDFDSGYAEFKIGVMLREAREQAGITQEKLAKITKTKKSAISRLENHAEDVRLSTVSRVARALGKTVRIELVEAT